MPLSDDKSIEDQITHGRHLTFVDKMRASVMPDVDSDPDTGRPRFPREEYLTQKALERKREADAAKSGN